jgi:hypothetical protein
MIYDGEEGLDAIMFPVREVKVFAEARAGPPRRASAYKALVNGDTGHVISVVSSSYQVLHNTAALRLARHGCTMGFPDTVRRAWQVTRIEAPRSGGHCAVDLSYRRPGKQLHYEWIFGTGVRERYEPFLRFRNGYNGRTPFSLHFGLMRLVCLNGWIEGRAFRIAKVSHDTKDIEDVVRQEIEKVNFDELASSLRHMLNDAWDFVVPREYFPTIIRSVLKIQRPKDKVGNRSDWSALRQAIGKKADNYADEFGTTAYALWNAMSDLASSPPVGYPLIRRSRHSLQQLASRWLSDFWGRIQDIDFNIDSYVKALSPKRSGAQER